MADASSPRPAPKRRKATELIVSLDELAGICGVTSETLRKHLKDAPDDADWMIERGRRGIGYKIAVAGAVDWWTNRAKGNPGEDDGRRAKLAEWRMTALGDGGDDEDLRLTGKERYEEYRAGEAELSYRQAIGELARVAVIEDETTNAVIELRRQLQAVGRTIKREFNLAKEVETAIDAAIGKKLDAFVAVLDGSAPDE